MFGGKAFFYNAFTISIFSKFLETLSDKGAKVKEKLAVLHAELDRRKQVFEIHCT